MATVRIDNASRHDVLTFLGPNAFLWARAQESFEWDDE